MSIPLPANPLHQRFADRVLAGDSNVDAYITAHAATDKKITRGSAQTQGTRWSKHPQVIAYITAIQAKAADETTLTVLEKRQFFARIVRVAVTAIDVDDEKRTNHDLIKKIKRRFDVDKETEREICVEEIEKHDPLKAIELDNKLSGDDPEANSLQQIAEALAAIATPSPLPTGKM